MPPELPHDEGAADDLDADKNPSTDNDSATQIDPDRGELTNWVVRKARAQVKLP